MEKIVEIENIGDRIRHFREARGMTASKLARSLSLTPGAVSNWENKVCPPRRSKLPSIAKVLGISTETLAGDTHHGATAETNGGTDAQTRSTCRDEAEQRQGNTIEADVAEVKECARQAIAAILRRPADSIIIEVKVVY